MRDPLTRAIDSVVRNDNCTGCGGCTLVSPRVSMNLRDGGWMRPTVSPEGTDDAREQARKFNAICPGVRLDAPPPEAETVHPTFGRYVSAWRGRAADDKTRAAGSSAGVLTAMSTFLVTSGRARSVRGAAMSPTQPTRTVPVTITSREEALTAAGSRYAPVSALDGFDISSGAIVAKPCEISALTRLRRLDPGGENPLTLSFFCAGTPSQNATRNLVTKLGVDVDRATSVRYRGNGWPGEFVATDGEARGALSYDDSWGKHLGRDLQWRCKICPDGTGEDADIAVGDFWKADERGYPLFDNADGESVVIARTLRGHDLLMEAARQGVVVLSEVDLDDVERIQPLQRARKRTLPFRLLARRLALRRVPRFTGYASLRRALAQPKVAAKTLIGTLSRSWRDRLNGRST